jgi:hypothetical protein
MHRARVVVFGCVTSFVFCVRKEYDGKSSTRTDAGENIV